MDFLLATRLGKFYLTSLILGIGLYILHQALESSFPAFCNNHLDPFLLGFTFPAIMEIGLIISKTKTAAFAPRVVFTLGAFAIIEYGLPQLNAYFIADPLDLGITLLSFLVFLILEHRVGTQVR